MHLPCHLPLLSCHYSYYTSELTSFMGVSYTRPVKIPRLINFPEEPVQQGHKLNQRAERPFSMWSINFFGTADPLFNASDSESSLCTCSPIIIISIHQQIPHGCWKEINNWTLTFCSDTFLPRISIHQQLFSFLLPHSPLIMDSSYCYTRVIVMIDRKRGD